MKKILFFLLWLYVLPACSGSHDNSKEVIKAHSQTYSPVSVDVEQPANWPWRGLTVDYHSEPKDLEQLVRMIPVNSVQLMLKPQNIAKKNMIPNSQLALRLSLEWADRMLDACQRLNLVAVVNLNRFPLDYNHPLRHRDFEFWQQKERVQEILDTATLLAQHFHKRGKEFVAYQIISEPTAKKIGRKRARPPQWFQVQNQIVQNIRKIDPQRWIVVAPGPGGSPTYTDFELLRDKRIIYGAHMYEPHAFTHQGIFRHPFGARYPGKIYNEYWDKDKLIGILQSLRDFQLEHNVLVWIGEFSAARWAPGSHQYLVDLVDIFNRYEWGWAYHSYNEAYTAWNPDFKAEYPKSRRLRKFQYVGESSKRWKTLRTLFRMTN